MGATGQTIQHLVRVTSDQLTTLNEIMALISSSTEENTECEVAKSFVSCLGINETAICLYL